MIEIEATIVEIRTSESEPGQPHRNLLESKKHRSLSRKHQILNFLIAATVVCVLYLPSCKTSKDVVSAKKFDADSVLAEFSKSAVPFDWLSARARVNYESASESKSFTAHIRMRRDSVIWLSITTIMGVEAARLVIRDDTVFLLDKLNKKYQAESLSLLEHYFPFPFDISLIQKIVAGEAMLPVSEQTKLKREKDGYMLVSENKRYSHSLTLNGRDLTISTEHLVDRQKDRRLSLVFADYKNDAGRLFSYARNLAFPGDEKIALQIKFSKVKWDEPQSFPFHVGEKYE